MEPSCPVLSRHWSAQATFDVAVPVRLGIGFGAVVVLLGGLSFVSLQAITSVRASEEQAARVGSIATALGESGTILGTARARIRDLVITGDPRFLAEADQALASATARAAPALHTARSGEEREAIAGYADLLERYAPAMARFREAQAVFDRLTKDMLALGTEVDRRLTDPTQSPAEPGVVHLAFQKAMTATAQFRLSGEAARVREALDQLALSRAALQDWAQTKGRPDVSATTHAMERLSSTLVQVAEHRGRAEDIRVNEINGFGGKAAQVAEALLARLRKQQQEATQAGVETMQASSTLIMSLAGAALVASIVLAVLIGRSVARPLNRVASALDRLATGDAATPMPDTARHDEVGRIARSAEGLRAVVGQAFEQGQILEQLPVAVLRADRADGMRVSYANARAKEVMATLEPTLGVGADALVGTQAERLHPEPARQRAMLDDKAILPTRERIVVGREVLDQVASRVVDQSGADVGVMLCWTVATQQARLADDFERDVGGVAAAVGSAALQMQAAARSVLDTARSSGEQARAVGEAGAQAEGDVHSVAAAAQELAASVSEISRQVAEGAMVARSAADEARSADGIMQGLAEAAGTIGDVVKLIGDIAGQTNLLALNATIEAARAGEAGKGFAVVASEVKQLANETARATQEIGQQIGAVQQATERAVEALRSIGGTVERIEGVTSAIAGAVEEQGAATREIAATAARVAEATGAVVTRIGLVGKSAEEAGGAAEMMLEAANDLGGRATALERGSSEFLVAVRRA